MFNDCFDSTYTSIYEITTANLRKERLENAQNMGIKAGFTKKMPDTTLMDDAEMQRFEDGVIIGLGMSPMDYLLHIIGIAIKNLKGRK